MTSRPDLSEAFCFYTERLRCCTLGKGAALAHCFILQVFTHRACDGLAAHTLGRDTPDQQPLSQHGSACNEHTLYC